MPPGVLSANEVLSISNLRAIMHQKSYPAFSHQFVEAAYRLVEKIYANKTRDDGSPAIVHTLSVAIRAAKMGLEPHAICAALLHDTIEDTNRKREGPKRIQPKDILELFGTEANAKECAQKTLGILLLLTKPKYLNNEQLQIDQRWVFPINNLYFSMNDDYYDCVRQDPSIYDERSEIYYRPLLNSGNLDAIALKILDNVHNAETMRGLPKEKIMKNLHTMQKNTMKHAAIFFVKEDVEYIKGLFDSLNVPIDRTVTPVFPSSAVIPFKLRDRFDVEALLSHPDPQYAYITIYGSKPIVAFATDHIEIGFPPRLGLNYRSVLEEYLKPDFDFVIERKQSAVPQTSPVNEEILEISGFTSREERLKVLRPSETEPGFFDLLGTDGKVVNSSTLTALATGESKLGEPASELFRQVEIKYERLKHTLSAIYQERLAPILMEHKINQN